MKFIQQNSEIITLANNKTVILPDRQNTCLYMISARFRKADFIEAVGSLWSIMIYSRGFTVVHTKFIYNRFNVEKIIRARAIPPNFVWDITI